MANPKARVDRDFKEGMRIVKECLRVIWEAQENGARLKFWALENPRGYLERFLGKPAFCYQPWQFGDTSHLATKRTWLWGFFMHPAPLVLNRSVPRIHDASRIKGRNTLFPIKAVRHKDFIKIQPDERSIASPYFTKAFFLANP